MTIQVKAEAISLRKKNKQIVQNINFTLEGNKIVGLLGRNGAGKTSLLSILAAFRPATNGQFLLNGEDVFENPKAMEQIIFVRERNVEYETEKVSRWIDTAQQLRPNFDRAYADELAKRFKLPQDSKVSKLSRGMQSALHVIIGLASRAPVTLFDEAYLGMDAPAREIFYEEVLRDFVEHPRLIILSTHLISEMDGLFEEVAIIHEGELLLHEGKEEVLERGYRLTGDAEAVDQLSENKRVLKTESLGGTKSVMVYGELAEKDERLARSHGLEIGTLSLQELFIHLTEVDHHE
ncbi:ABC transporter [Geomicrobium sp. JCM 19037]|uniref:ATP-binding cassette domain-containing protein n=1 Tax=Geomicrobium sp. JCM 19037 TaxID=1460634 RepID=UPI00045F3E41|nr:ABC transporter ATP-binding protein [Geomicrobium sp. JCM 19037]GAK02216.1 ABC transporter [Geomicrobium sp. JCM 19037]